MKALVTTSGLKSMIGIELMKTKRIVDNAISLHSYPVKVKAYRKAKALKALSKKLYIESDESIAKQLGELSGREITLR